MCDFGWTVIKSDGIKVRCVPYRGHKEIRVCSQKSPKTGGASSDASRGSGIATRCVTPPTRPSFRRTTERVSHEHFFMRMSTTTTHGARSQRASASRFLVSSSWVLVRKSLGITVSRALKWHVGATAVVCGIALAPIVLLMLIARS